MADQDLDEAAQRGRALYDFGATPIFAARVDPRFSYCLYVPPGFAKGGPAPDLVMRAVPKVEAFMAEVLAKIRAVP